jgi:phage terminase large subunit-like protein
VVIRRSDFAHLPPLVLESDEGETEVPDYPAIAKAYAEAVATGQKPTNRLMVLAARRYLDMLEMAEDPDCEFYFSPLHVIDYCLFAERFEHFESGTWELTQKRPDGRPDPRIILEPWQIWIEAAIQGFRRRLTGERLVSIALEVVPRKNAKSLKAAIAAFYDLTCSGQMAPEIPVAAASAKQAKDTVFGDMLKMLEKEKDFVEQFELDWTEKEIRGKDGGRIFMLTSQGERQDGLNPSLALFEEGHSGAASVYKVVRSAFGARPNALLRMITTAGYRPEGPGYDLMLDAIAVLEGKGEDYTLFAAIYTLDKEDYLDPESNMLRWDELLTNEELVAKANPMYGIALDPVKIRSELGTARRRPDQRNEVARTRYNIWTAAGSGLIDHAAWMACRQAISVEDFIGSDVRCWMGVDLASTLDMCAVTLVFELPGDQIAVFMKAYLPDGSETYLDPEMQDQFDAWAEAGWMELTPGPLADHDRIRKDIVAFCGAFNVQAVACDPQQAHNTVKKLWDGNYPAMTYPNSARTMTAPTDDILGRIAVQSLIHDGNPVLAWHAQNVHGDRWGNGTIMPRKEKKNSTRKIDGFVALCFANGVRLQPDDAEELGAEEQTKRSAYEGRVIGLDD